MTNIPLLLMPVVALAGVVITGGLVYLMANSKRNNPTFVGIPAAEDIAIALDGSFADAKNPDRSAEGRQAIANAVVKSMPAKLHIAIGGTKLIYRIDDAGTAEYAAHAAVPSPPRRR